MRKVLLEGRRERPVLCTGLNRRRMRAPGGAHISSKKAVVPSANAPPSGRGSTDGLFYKRNWPEHESRLASSFQSQTVFNDPVASRILCSV